MLKDKNHKKGERAISVFLPIKDLKFHSLVICFELQNLSRIEFYLTNFVDLMYGI